jgi:hypothetical protein
MTRLVWRWHYRYGQARPHMLYIDGLATTETAETIDSLGEVVVGVSRHRRARETERDAGTKRNCAALCKTLSRDEVARSIGPLVPAKRSPVPACATNFCNLQQRVAGHRCWQVFTPGVQPSAMSGRTDLRAGADWPQRLLDAHVQRGI